MENDVALAIVRNDLEQLLALTDPAKQKVVLILTLISSYFNFCCFIFCFQLLGEYLHGFKELFEGFLEDRKLGAKVDWKKIRPPPPGSVCH